MTDIDQTGDEASAKKRVVEKEAPKVPSTLKVSTQKEEEKSVEIDINQIRKEISVSSNSKTPNKTDQANNSATNPTTAIREKISTKNSQATREKQQREAQQLYEEMDKAIDDLEEDKQLRQMYGERLKALKEIKEKLSTLKKLDPESAKRIEEQISKYEKRVETYEKKVEASLKKLEEIEKRLKDPRYILDEELKNILKDLESLDDSSKNSPYDDDRIEKRKAEIQEQLLKKYEEDTASYLREISSLRSSLLTRGSPDVPPYMLMQLNSKVPAAIIPHHNPQLYADSGGSLYVLFDDKKVNLDKWLSALYEVAKLACELKKRNKDEKANEEKRRDEVKVKIEKRFAEWRVEFPGIEPILAQIQTQFVKYPPTEEYVRTLYLNYKKNKGDKVNFL